MVEIVCEWKESVRLWRRRNRRRRKDITTKEHCPVNSLIVIIEVLSTSKNADFQDFLGN